MATKKKNPYYYSLTLEHALLELFGFNSKWYGKAGSFQNSKNVREAILAATLRIRKRVNEIITMDNRLLTTTDVTIDAIERSAKALSNDQNNLLNIVGHLLHFIAYLLGYDWLKGNPNRHVIYYQTVDQEWVDDVSKYPDTVSFASRNKEDNKRYEIVNTLFDDGFRAAEISRIMKLPSIKS